MVYELYVSLNGVTFRVCENLFQVEKIYSHFVRILNEIFHFLIFYFVIEIISKFFFHLFFRVCEINDRNDAQFHLVRVWFDFHRFCNKIFEDFRQEVKKTRLCYVF